MSPMSPRLLRPRATGFSPKQIAGLAAWWDASDSKTLFSDTGKTTLATHGMAVAAWTSKAGSLTATQTTSGARPVRNGSRLQFTALTSFMSIASAGSQFSSAGEVFVVFEPTSGTYELYSTRENSSYFRLTANSGSYFGFLSTDRVNNVAAGAPSGGLHIATQYTNASSQVVRVDGVQIYSGTPVNGFNAGATHYIGADGPSALLQTGLGGFIAEVVVFNTVLSSADRARVEGYLAWKWGLQATLPYDHPYAASFPGYGTQATPTDADALAYLSAVRTADGGTGVEVGVANAVDSFVKGCKSDGTWGAIKASCILAGARTLSGALVPLAGTAPTNNGFVAADYSRANGLIGDATSKYLNSNRLDGADSQNDVHLSTYVSTASSTVKMYAGTQNHYIYRDTADVRLVSRNAQATIVPSGSLTGLYGHSRAASGSFTSRFSGVTNTHSGPSSEPMGTNVYVFGRNVSNAVSLPSNARLAFYSIGTSIDLAKLDTRLTRLINEAQYNLNTGLSGSSYATETLAYINAGYAAGGTLA